LLADKTPFRLIVEPQEVDLYANEFKRDIITALPFSNLGLGSIPARNWCWEDAKSAGHQRHWILDDNISRVMRRFQAQRFPCDSGVALAAMEDFVDRYENIAVAGPSYTMFAPEGRTYRPVIRNAHVYSCLLIDNSLPNRWRGRYNEDTDLCLQVLASGLCTVQFRAFLVDKKASMSMKGGNTAELYCGDGRLKMARSLERMWPGVVQTIRRFGRPQHIIKNAWRKFDTPLKLKPGIELSKLEPNEYGLKLTQVKSVVKHPSLKKLLKS
jgi:hypothetical protein